MVSRVKIVSININGLNSKIKQKRVAAHFSKLAPDAILMQETHLRKESDLILNSKKYPIQFHAAGSSKARSVSILFKKDLSFHVKDKMQCKRGRFLFVKGELEGEMVTFASVYAPNNGQIGFLQQTFQDLASFSEGTVYVAGDFNYVVELSQDRTYKGLQSQFHSFKFY